MTRLALIVLSLSAISCTEECVDQFDCLKVSTKQTLTCDDGRCVVKSSLPSFMLPTPRDAGTVTPSDGGLPTARILPGDYTARLSGAQLIPPVTTMGTGTVAATLAVSDAGASLSWTINVTTLTPANVALMVGAPAGRQTTTFLRLNDGGVPLPFTGTIPVSSATAQAISGAQASIIVTTAAKPFGELRGQLVPKGAILGTSQFVRSRDGQYGGGGQLLLETDGGFIPVAGSFQFDWSESGAVANAAVSQLGTPLLPLPLDAAKTGSAGTFEPLALLVMLRDAGLVVVGTDQDGGEVFRGDLSLR